MITILAQLELLKSALLYNDQFLNNSAFPPPTSPQSHYTSFSQKLLKLLIFFSAFQISYILQWLPYTQLWIPGKNPPFKVEEAHLAFKT